MPQTLTLSRPVPSLSETSTASSPTRSDVLNIYLFIKALTFALIGKAKGGRVFADEYELEMGVPYSDAYDLASTHPFPCIVRGNADGFDVLLPDKHLKAIQTRKGLNTNIKMMSALPAADGYVYLLRQAFSVHASRFPALYTRSMLRSIEGPFEGLGADIPYYQQRVDFIAKLSAGMQSCIDQAALLVSPAKPLSKQKENRLQTLMSALDTFDSLFEEIKDAPTEPWVLRSLKEQMHANA